VDSDDALRIVSALKSMELIDISAVKNTGRGAVTFIKFLESFWDYDKSEYIQERLAHGYRFSRRYAKECQKRLNTEVRSHFGDKKLNCITTDDLKNLSKQLAASVLSKTNFNMI